MHLRAITNLVSSASLVALLILIAGCLYSPSQKSTVIRIADGDLVVKKYKKLGISVALPQNAMDVSVWSQRWYQRDTGCKTLSFVLGKALTWPDETLFWTGNVDIWEVGSAVQPAKAGATDTVQIESLSYQRLGWDQKVFSLEHRLEDGRRLMASITYCEYGGDQLRREADLEKMTNILQSVSFEQKIDFSQ